MLRMLEKRSLSYTDGPVPVPPDDQFLTENVQRICICDTGIFFSLSMNLITEVNKILKEKRRNFLNLMITCAQYCNFLSAELFHLIKWKVDCSTIFISFLTI